MKADSGASQTFIKKEHSHFLTDLVPLRHGPEAILPDKSRMKASNKGSLSFFPSSQHTALIFPELKSESLLSIGQLCDEGNIAIFDDKNLTVLKKSDIVTRILDTIITDNTVIQGHRNLQDGLYNVPFSDMKSNYVVTKEKNKLELAQFSHACAF